MKCAREMDRDLQPAPEAGTISPGMQLLLEISTTDPRNWAALVVAITGVAVVLLRPKFKKKDPLTKTPFSGLAQQRSVERQMQNLLVELSEMTRQMNSQIDTRAAKLEQLIKQADERIDALRPGDRAPTANVSGEDRVNSPGLTSPESSSPVLDQFDSDPSRPPTPPADPAQPPSPGPSTFREPERDAAPAEIDPRHAEIYTLADQGQGPREIASHLGRPSGEVELILALRPRT